MNLPCSDHYLLLDLQRRVSRAEARERLSLVEQAARGWLDVPVTVRHDTLLRVAARQRLTRQARAGRPRRPPRWRVAATWQLVARWLTSPSGAFTEELFEHRSALMAYCRDDREDISQ